MTLLSALIMGVIEGITEFLPISSTGHLILAASLLHIATSDFLKTFEIVVQLGAILAVAVLYWKSFLNLELDKKLVVGFIPTGIIGLALYHVEKTYFLGPAGNWIVIVALFLGGTVFILFEKWHGAREDLAPAIPAADLTYKQAGLMGLAQAVAIIPGVSRSGATIVGGMALGIARSTIVEFSFLLAVPTVLAASGLSLVSSSGNFTPHEWTALALGFVVSFLVALPAVKWLLAYIRRHSFTAFGVYRIILALVFALILFG